MNSETQKQVVVEKLVQLLGELFEETTEDFALKAKEVCSILFSNRRSHFNEFKDSNALFSILNQQLDALLKEKGTFLKEVTFCFLSHCIFWPDTRIERKKELHKCEKGAFDRQKTKVLFFPFQKQQHKLNNSHSMGNGRSIGWSVLYLAVLVRSVPIPTQRP